MAPEQDEHDGKLSRPTKCDACGFARILLRTNEAIFGAGCIGPQDRVYFCPQCKASVGVRKGSDIPLGYMADSETRRLRAVAHNEFDPLWREGRYTRRAAYRLLAELLGLDLEACHIGRMDRTTLFAALNAIRELKSDSAKIKKRREAKKRVNQQRAAERAAKQAKWLRKRRFDDY